MSPRDDGPAPSAGLQLIERGELTVRVPVEAGRRRAWQAYTTPELRRRWMRLPGVRGVEELDLVEGGHERLTSDFAVEADRNEHLEYASFAREYDLPRASGQ